VRLIRIHNKSTYNRIYNIYSKDFIDTFVENRMNGKNTAESLEAGKIAVQIKATLEIAMNSPNKLVAIKAYNNIKTDSELIQKAIRFYQGMK
jgi:hypothetical protein